MSRNDFQGKKSEVPDEDYEKTVLNFLNREIAQTQSEGEAAQNPSNEVESIVSDLMKQVISESDSQQKIPQLYSENLDSMLSEFPDATKDEPSPNGKSAKNGSQPVQTAGFEHAPNPEIFASSTAQAANKKIPFKAIALIIALAIVGAAIYFLAGFRHSAPTNASTPAPISNPAPSVSQNQNQAVQSTPVSAARQEANPAPAAITPVSPVSAKTENKETPKSTSAVESAAPNAVPVTAKKETAVNPPDTQAAFAASTALQFAPTPATSNKMVISALENASTVKVVVPPPPPPEPPAASASPAKADPVVSKDVVPATLVSHIAPRYPPIALRTKTSAIVVLELQIDNTGKVTKATPVSGPNVFFDEAVRAAMRWLYKPASINGTNVPSKSSVTMQFKLD
jgi:TonB family protein